MPLKPSPTEEIIAEIRAGRMVILTDDECRENEGDLIIAADIVTPEAVNFMATHGRGLICLAMTGDMIDRLDIPPMPRRGGEAFSTAFTVSIEARDGVTTGISAHDRARTIQVAVSPFSTPADIVTPGHIFPLRARSGGVLERAGHTEAAADLAFYAGFAPAGVICEIMADDGTMARLPQLLKFAEKHKIKIGTIADLIEYRKEHERKIAAE